MTCKSGRSRPETWLPVSGPILLAATLAAGMPAQALAGPICATTSCTLQLDTGNSSSGFGTGDFGTVELILDPDSSIHTVHITVTLAPGFFIVKTGFPGSFGFTDSLGGGLTIGNFSSPAYSGSLSHATDDLHFDGFGYVDDAAATTGPQPGSASALGTVSFDVTKAGLTDVNQLLNLASPAGGDGPAYFIVDVVDRNITLEGGSHPTGLITASDPPPPPNGAPEPASLGLVGIGVIALGAIRRRRGQSAKI